MGNFCRINKGTISIDNNQTVMVESDTEIKVVLRFLFEKMHYMKTEESRLRINDQLKEIFNECNDLYDNIDDSITLEVLVKVVEK